MCLSVQITDTRQGRMRYGLSWGQAGIGPGWSRSLQGSWVTDRVPLWAPIELKARRDGAGFQNTKARAKYPGTA